MENKRERKSNIYIYIKEKKEKTGEIKVDTETNRETSDHCIYKPQPKGQGKRVVV